MRNAWSSIGRLWCKMAHDDLMWPAHGYYRCRTCFRLHPVPWEHSELEPALPKASPLHVQSWSQA